ncbi:BRD4-interacting chromatin-remodeling complex-associated protein-like isoform X1 [Leopardus geoffroyi]|uniref:BRD4-interacting chromatin-remodeling complex-associated protein-like isoform X1 n=1 Tax=Leopardus geoffroyi TaxID=46844 RepID=UPI001E25F4DD|nr:BRD4-interacting chromatin-remodeling complex-associated protein-like isoform X1 [Leopardus geoffroyi]
MDPPFVTLPKRWGSQEPPPQEKPRQLHLLSYHPTFRRRRCHPARQEAGPPTSAGPRASALEVEASRTAKLAWPPTPAGEAPRPYLLPSGSCTRQSQHPGSQPHCFLPAVSTPAPNSHGSLHFFRASERLTPHPCPDLALVLQAHSAAPGSRPRTPQLLPKGQGLRFAGSGLAPKPSRRPPALSYSPGHPQSAPLPHLGRVGWRRTVVPFKPRTDSTRRRSRLPRSIYGVPLLPPVPRNFWKVGNASGGRPGSAKKKKKKKKQPKTSPRPPWLPPLPLRALTLSRGHWVLLPPNRGGALGTPSREAGHRTARPALRVDTVETPDFSGSGGHSSFFGCEMWCCHSLLPSHLCYRYS